MITTVLVLSLPFSLHIFLSLWVFWVFWVFGGFCLFGLFLYLFIFFGGGRVWHIYLKLYEYNGTRGFQQCIQISYIQKKCSVHIHSYCHNLILVSPNGKSWQLQDKIFILPCTIRLLYDLNSYWQLFLSTCYYRFISKIFFW